MNVSLTPELDRFIAEKLEGGTYASQSEVVRAGLRLLMERERLLEVGAATWPVGASPAPSRAEGDRARSTSRLPPVLWHHFPDLAPDRLRYPADRATILPRLLGAAQLDAIRWLKQHVEPEDLTDFLRMRQGAGLDPKSLRFWGVLLDVPRNEVDAWVARVRDNPWTKRTKR